MQFIKYAHIVVSEFSNQSTESIETGNRCPEKEMARL